MIENFFEIIFLGIIEGLTEFFPISSTAHLIIFEEILVLNLSSSETFSIAIQLGAILAALFHFRSFFSPFRNPSFLLSSQSRKLFIAITPVLFVGFFCYDFIKSTLFNIHSVAYALLAGAVIMLVLEHVLKPKITLHNIKDMTYMQAFIIGLFQCFSLWPGMSRSGSCMIGALAIGASYKVAAEFAFIIGVPVLSAAVLYDLLKVYSLLNAYDIYAIFIASFVAFIVAYIAIVSFVSLLQRFKLTPFAIYRCILALLLLTFFA